VTLNPDKAVGKVKDPNQAGIISIRMTVLQKDKKYVDWRAYSCWKYPPAERLETIRVRAYVYMARDLPSADEDG